VHHMQNQFSGQWLYRAIEPHKRAILSAAGFSYAVRGHTFGGGDVQSLSASAQPSEALCFSAEMFQGPGD
jgi:hypothetical protein